MIKYSQSIREGAQAVLGIVEESPERAMAFAGKKGEDLERKARAAGNTHIYKLIKKNTTEN